jgi:hypothetical protein
MRASTCLSFFTGLALAVEPSAIYNGGFNSTSSSNSSILLRVGNGGAGQSGLVGGEHLIDKPHRTLHAHHRMNEN